MEKLRKEECGIWMVCSGINSRMLSTQIIITVLRIMTNYCQRQKEWNEMRLHDKTIKGILSQTLF